MDIHSCFFNGSNWIIRQGELSLVNWCFSHKRRNQKRIFRLIKPLLSLLLLLQSVTGKSQDISGSDFTADRPGFATSPFIAGTHKLLLELGFAYEKITQNQTFNESILYPNTLFRFGLNSTSELRIQWDYAQLKTDNQIINGFKPLVAGTKLNITKGSGLVPHTSFMFNLALPGTGQKKFRLDHLAPSAYLLMQNDFSEKLNLGYNIGVEYDGASVQPSTFLAICLGYNFSKKLSGFLENYNWYLLNAKPENYVDLGLAYLLRKYVQLDLSGNLNIQPGLSYFMINLGVAWRITGEHR
jgi:hypothetical protein